MPDNAPDVLVDAPEDGCAEERLWVDAAIARDLLPAMVGTLERDFLEDPEEFRVAVEEATRVTLIPSQAQDGDWEALRWNEVDAMVADLKADGMDEDYIAARRVEARDWWQIPVEERGADA